MFETILIELIVLLLCNDQYWYIHSNGNDVNNNSIISITIIVYLND